MFMVKPFVIEHVEAIDYPWTVIVCRKEVSPLTGLSANLLIFLPNQALEANSSLIL